jgi:tetratricopeptide (TPR) repeat protein
MHLVDQAKASLAQGKADPAIPLLEQAIQVDVHNGEAFFTLARAWRMKGARQKALQFAQKAEILSQDDPAKLKQVYLLEADLHKELGDAAKADAYRQKALKLR